LRPEFAAQVLGQALRIAKADASAYAAYRGVPLRSAAAFDGEI